MFFDDRKKQITSILSKRNSKGGVEMQPTPMKAQIHMNEGGELDGRHVAAQDILAAHHAKDPAALMEALGNFVNLHLANEGDKPEVDEGQEP